MAAKQAKVRQSIRYVMSGGHSAKHISAPVSGLCSICFFTLGLLVGKVWIDIISGCCAVGSAPALGAGGPGFESPHSDQKKRSKKIFGEKTERSQDLRGPWIMKIQGPQNLD